MRSSSGVLFLLALLLPAFTFAQNLRKRTSFDSDWKFQFGHAADPAKDFNYGIPAIFSKSGKTDQTALAARFNDTVWRSLNLPHDWAVELPFSNSPNFDVQSHGYKPVGGLYPETNIGWYRKHFTVHSQDSGHRFQLSFDGVFRDAKFWINGFYLGTNESGYVGVSYDITDYLNYNRDNVITVRVDATQYEGWFYEGAGIYRHVWLNEYDNLHVAENGVFVSTVAKGNSATVNIETVVENSDIASLNGEVKNYITNREGQRLASGATQKLSLTPTGISTVRHSLSVSQPTLWSLDEPYLYRLVTVVFRNGKTVDSTVTKFGIRTVDIKADGVYLNGKYVKIYGTNNHQDHAGLGSALPDYLQYYRVRLLKDMGSNAYRASHHAPTPELLDACDSLGMLVLDEQRLLNSSPEYMSQFERLIRRDRNHPSVFLWSIGNEEGWIQTTTTGKRIAQTLIARQRQLDPTRISTYAADVANVYKGVNEVIPVRGFNYRHAGVADYHRDHPNQPILGTEMGSTVTTRGIYRVDSAKAYLPDQDITAPWWASTAEAWMSLAGPNRFWLGGFVWTGFDYRGEPTPFQWPNVSSHFGIMDVCGFPKNIYYYYQSWWTNKDVLHISPHWNPPAGEAGPVDVWVDSNADNVELFLNGKSLGKKDMPRFGHLQWKVNYEPGKLEAIAYKNGKKLTAKQETTGPPAEVVVTPYKTTMLANGQDAAVINISVVDRQGREVPDANQLIRFALTGDAKIIGVGNGDPSSHEQDRYNDSVATRRLFNGKCQVIILAGKTPGVLRFEATADSLWKGSTDIITVGHTTITQSEPYQPKPVKKNMGKMLGADISFLPELEARGIRFSDNGREGDAIEILKDHGINYIRLRIFNNPSLDSGYSPGKGFCDLDHTLAMAKRIKAAGLKFLLDFHYSDYWADPGKQYKPKAWRQLRFKELRDSVYAYTRRVVSQLKMQGTPPDMIQIGNEINHGLIWPEGNVQHLDSLAILINAGTRAALEVDPTIIMMLHVALGGQNDESVFFINNMLQRGVYFDVIGESYYPKWHGTLSDLENNLNDLSLRYKKDIVVVEYSQLKHEVNKLAFEVRDGRGKGSFIWEPLSTWEAVFDRQGRSNDYLKMYDEIRDRYLK